MKRLISIFSIFGILSLAYSQTNVPAGDVHGNWDLNGSPYKVNGNIFIEEDSTLYIDQGVKVEFQGHYELKVLGRLLAEGTETDSIIFTINDTTGFSNRNSTEGAWYGIRIYDINEDNDSTKLSYCRLEYGKAVGPGWFLNAGGALCIIRFDKVEISNCTFRNNSAGGPEDQFPAGGAIHLAWSDIQLTDNTFMNNYAYAGGAIQIHESNPVFENNTIMNNHCIWDGGGISSGGGSNPIFSGDLISNNSSEQMGGGITFWNGTDIILDQVTIENNSANWGGGIGFLGCVAEIKNSNISKNHVSWLGGGIAADNSLITVKNSTFEKDTALSFAGAIHTWIGTLIVKNCMFKENAGEAGGAIHVDFGNLEIDSSSFVNNFAQHGGALHVYNSNLKLDSCLFDSNEAQYDGGAIDYGADSLVFDSLYHVNIYNSRILNNKANAAGGFTVEQFHMDTALIDLEVDNCVIGNNRAHHVGGFRIIRCINNVRFSNSIVRGNIVEAWTAGGNMTSSTKGDVYNCLFYNNQSATVNAGSSSGGLGVTTGSNVNILNCTFANNSAGVGGGLMLYRGGDANVVNSIFWGNSPDQIGMNAIIDSLQCIGTFNYSDIQNGLDSIQVNDTVSKVHWGEGNINSDPLFTNWLNGDYTLQSQSPAIGAGIDSLEIESVWHYIPTHDINGEGRPAPLGSLPDMGAFEDQQSWPLSRYEEYEENNDHFNSRNFPNPFNTVTTIEFNIAERSYVHINLYNMLGVQLKTILNSELEPGKHSIEWKPNLSESGFYFYQITSRKSGGEIYMQTKRMLFIKE